MWRIYKAIRKLVLFAWCNHHNTSMTLAFPDSTELRFCRECGRIISCLDEGGRTHNPWMAYPTLDYTRREREQFLEAEEKMRAIFPIGRIPVVRKTLDGGDLLEAVKDLRWRGPEPRTIDEQPPEAK